MMRRTLVGAVVLVLATTPASAQFAVIDPANLAQAILIVQRTQRHLEELRAQYPNDRPDGAGSWADGPVPDAAVCPDAARRRAVELRTSVDHGAQ